MQNADWQEKLFFCRQKRGNIRFYKILILGNPLAYGTAEAGEMITN